MQILYMFAGRRGRRPLPTQFGFGASTHLQTRIYLHNSCKEPNFNPFPLGGYPIMDWGNLLSDRGTLREAQVQGAM